MSTYERMISTATVGLGAKPLSDGVFDVPVDTGAASVLDPDDPVGTTLRVAALYAVARRAGHLPATVEPTVAPAPVDPRPLITETHAFLMERALAVRPVLDGLIGDIAAAGRRLPARLIPGLLRVYQNDGVRHELWDVIGTDGRWFAEQRYGRGHRALRLVIASPAEWPDEARYTHGDAAARQEFLAAARRIDPDRARELVAAHWASEDAASRVMLLAALTTPEHPGDEPFLEAALDDKAGTVRSAATEALGARSASRYLDRMKGRSAQIFSVKKSMLGVKITVNPTPSPDAAAVRDGLGNATAADIVARTAISYWAEFFGTVPPDKVARSLDDAELLAALTISALRGNDARWAIPLLRRCLPPDYATHFAPSTADPEIAAELIRTLAKGTAAGAALVAIVAALPRPFAPAVATALFESLPSAAWGTASQRRDAAAHLAAGFPLEWRRPISDLIDRTTDEELHKFYATVFELLALRIDIAKELP